ncbi:MAG: hypothetical protein GY754_15410 [bacterium]|nr:hypothetical protein [bacterium]
MKIKILITIVTCIFLFPFSRSSFAEENFRHVLILHSYNQNKPDLIISSDNHAFDFLRKYRDKFPDSIKKIEEAVE